MVCYNRFVIFLVTFQFASCCTDSLCREAVVDSNKIRHLSTKTIPDHYLNVTALETAEVISDRHCLHNCLKNEECFSMNLHTNGTTLECSLLTEQAYTNVTELVTDSNCKHLTVKNSFCDDHCMNGGTCIPDYETNSGSCLCPDGFQGSRCSQEDTTPNNQPQVTVFGYTVTPDDSINDLLQLDGFLAKDTDDRSCSEMFSFGVTGDQGIYILAYFTPTETGYHYFRMVCGHKCRVYITTNGKYSRRAIIGTGSSGDAFLSNTEKRLHLAEGVKYLIEFIGKAGAGVTVNSNTIAIVFPSGHIIDPLEAENLSAN